MQALLTDRKHDVQDLSLKSKRALEAQRRQGVKIVIPIFYSQIRARILKVSVLNKSVEQSLEK